MKGQLKPGTEIVCKLCDAMHGRPSHALVRVPKMFQDHVHDAPQVDLELLRTALCALTEGHQACMTELPIWVVQILGDQARGNRLDDSA